MRLEINKNKKSKFQFFSDIFGSTWKIVIFKTTFGSLFYCATNLTFFVSLIVSEIPMVRVDFEICRLRNDKSICLIFSSIYKCIQRIFAICISIS